jgi:hypothetical protein
MATATTKKKTARPAAKKARSSTGPALGRKQPAKARDPLADIEAPERSSPPLAEVDAEALEFIAAIDRFKKENARPFPSWSEILLIVRQLGYQRR